jgi:hypothetical protein
MIVILITNEYHWQANMMARPTKHDKINLDRLREAAASCGSLEDIAAALRLSVRTFFTARENDPEIDEVIAQARQETHQLRKH